MKKNKKVRKKEFNITQNACYIMESDETRMYRGIIQYIWIYIFSFKMCKSKIH